MGGYKSMVKESDLAINETTGSASNPITKQTMKEATDEITMMGAMTWKVEQRGEMINNPLLPRQ